MIRKSFYRLAALLFAAAVLSFVAPPFTLEEQERVQVISGASSSAEESESRPRRRAPPFGEPAEDDQGTPGKRRGGDLKVFGELLKRFFD